MKKRLNEDRRRILDAARNLVAKGGFRAARMSAIAQDAGVSTGTLYRHFGSQADLFVKLLGQAVRQQIAALRMVAAEPRSAQDRLSAAIESFVRRALAGPHLAYAFIAEPADERVERARIRYRRAFAEVYKTILRDGIASGEFEEQDVDIAAACLFGAFTEALVGPLAGKGRSIEAKERLVNAVCQFCGRAIIRRGALPPSENRGAG